MSRMFTLLTQIPGLACVWLVTWLTAPRKRDERGASAVDWLIVTGATIGIAYFAGDSIMAFAKDLVGQLK